MKKVLFLVSILLILLVLIGCNDKPSKSTACKHDDPTKIEVVEAKDSTCKEMGLTQGLKCLVCGTMVVPQIAIDKTECVEMPVYTQEGMYYTKCIYCGRIIQEETNPLSSLLVEVLPNGKSFEELDVKALSLPEGIMGAYREINGAGFVFEVNSTGFNKGLVIRVGVDADGNVTGSTVVSSNETWQQEASLNGKYNGQNAETLELIIAAGATPQSQTSKGYYNAIDMALRAYTLVSGGKLSPEIVLEEMLPLFHTGMVNRGSIVASYVSPNGNIVKGWMSTNNTGAAYIMSKGENMYLVLVNNAGVAAVYDENKVDVTADHYDLVEEAVMKSGINYRLNNGSKSKIKNCFGEEAVDSIEMLTFKTFNNVSLAAKFTVNGETVYLFQSKPLYYDNTVMTAYVFMAEDGKVLKLDISQLFVDEHYIPGFEGAPEGYLDRVIDKTQDTFNGEDLLISGATMTSTAVIQSVTDAFAALNSIQNQ